MKILKRKTLAALLALSLLASLLPLGAQPAQAATPNGQVIYVGNENVTRGGYWTTDSDGSVTQYTEEGTPSNNYIHYNAETNTLTLHNATIKKGLAYDENITGGTYIIGSAIGVFNQNSAAELTITLAGTNTIEDVSTGIFVLAHSSSTGDASLTITGSGSLTASGNINGINVQSNGDNATLTIQSADVTLTSNSGNGVTVQAGSTNSSGGHTITLSVEGGSLTASGSTGISFDSASSYTVSATNLTVSNNAIVRANDVGSNISNVDLQIGKGNNSSGGIVFDGNQGTVYGSVTLQEDLTIESGQTLDIPSGASLTIGNGATLTVNGGELTGENIPTEGVVYKVTEVTLSQSILTLDVGDTATLAATVTPTNATNQNVTWESSNPSVATVDESGKVTAVASGEATITVTTADGSKTANCDVTVNAATTITTQPQSVSVTEGQSATFSVTATGDNLCYQWQINSGNGWSDIIGATDASYTIDRTTTAMGGNQYRCIVTGDGGEVASDAAMLTVNDRPTIPPVTPPSVSEETIDAILDAEPGETVSVALEDGDTTLDAEVFETLAGQDITLEIALEGGVTWTVNGQDIPADANLDDLDLGVEMDSDGIPVDVVNSITGERDTVQMTLAHDGDFGFTMTLTAPLGVENAGYWANLYHYDEDADQLTFETAAEIDADGSVSLPMSHASQYAIVIDTHSHATVDVSDLFLDVAPNAWYKDAVQYAYDSGLMTGVSATEFAPEQTTTRAMIVSILARLEGVTTAQAAGFNDVTDEWYATAVNWAASVGVVNGYEDNTFRPNTAITREQLAAILMNYAAYKGEDVSNRADLTSYTDQPSTWATETMSWAVAEGLISGVTADTLQPQGNATRAQVAAILQRFLSE